jgi:outer membrane receptor for ferrienterochelin and colicins
MSGNGKVLNRMFRVEGAGRRKEGYATMRLLVTLFLILFLAALPVGSFASVALTGTVQNLAGDPLPGVSVRIAGTHIGAATDLAGDFVITGLNPGTYTLAVSHVGYVPIEQEVLITDSVSDPVLIELKSSTVELDEVVYTATRTMHSLADVPVTTELVSSMEIRESASFDAAEALASEIGLDVREDFAGQGVMLQGIDPERVLILVDGNRVIGRVNGSIDLSQISTQNIKQIEIVKGAVSTLYGSEAIGGVINVITDRASQPFKMNVELAGGGYLPSGNSHDRELGPLASQMVSPAIDMQIQRGRVGVTLGGRYQSQGLMDIRPETDHTEGSEAADRLSGNARIDVKMTEHTNFFSTFAVMDENKDWVEESAKEDPLRPGQFISFNDMEENKRTDFSVGVECNPHWADHYMIKAYRTANSHEWEKYTKSGLLRDYSRSEEDFTQLEAQFTRTFADVHRVTTGADFYWWNIETNSRFGEIASSSVAELTAWDVYLQDEWYVTPDVTLVPGVRHEVHEIYGINVAPQLSARWKVADSITLRSSVGRGYRAPSSKELYYDFNHISAGYVVYGNEQLDPEKSTNVNFSIEHVYKDRSSSRITFFYNKLNDLIDFQQVGEDELYYAGIYQYNNVVSARTAGVELERTMQLLRDVRFTMAYSYLWAHNDEIDNRLLRRPEHSGRWVLSWSPGDLTCRMWGRYTGEMLYEYKFDQSAQTSDDWTKPYTLWNLAVTYRLPSDVSIYVKTENLFDYTNPTYGPFRGRVVTMGARYSFGQNWLQ